jgi:small basic protein
MSDLVWLSLAILAGLCIDIIIPTFLSIVILAVYYAFISEVNTHDDKHFGAKLFIVAAAILLLMWAVDFFPGRELTLFLSQ